MAAAIYLQRAGVSPLLLERGEPGGLLRSANLVENYPGFPQGIPGKDLASRFRDQLAGVGAQVTRADVRSVRRIQSGFEIGIGARRTEATAVILATGTRPAETSLRGARTLRGKRLFGEIHELPRPLEGRRVLIIGGGDAAFDYALSLRGEGARTIIVSRSEPSCLALLRERTEAMGAETVIGAQPEAVHRVRGGVAVDCAVGASKIVLAADLVLMACGRVPNIEVLSPNLRHKIREDGKAPPETGVPGLYLAGDVVRDRQRQTGIAVGDGIRAAMLARAYLDEVSG